MRRFFRYLLPYLTAFIFSLLGVALWHLTGQSSVLLVVSGILAAIPLLCLLVNVVSANAYLNKIKQAKIADMQKELLRHRREAEKTAVTKLTLLRRIRLGTGVYTACLFLMAAAAGVFSGACYAPVPMPVYLLLLAYAGTVFYDCLYRTRRQKPDIEQVDLTTLVQESDYPQLYEMARRAADTLGCRGRIVIRLNVDDGVSIFCVSGGYVLTVGAQALQLLCEEEFYHILLHEFSHVSRANARAQRERDYNAGLCVQHDEADGFTSFAMRLFMLSDVCYNFQYMIFDYATSVCYETSADRAMAEYGQPAIAASALVKFNDHRLYEWERGVEDEPCLYEPEAPQADYLHREFARFEAARETRADVWHELAKKEIIANNTTHPTLIMRLETLGVTEVATVAQVSSEAYTAECQKAVDFAETYICEQLKDGYAKTREENYIKPQERVREWTENGMPIRAEGYADIIDDLRALGRNREAEALCDRVLATLDKMSCMTAAFFKGSYLLRRYDESGMDYLWQAVDNNSNYVDEGLTLIGEFCCITGRQEDLNAYREKAAVMAQKTVDETDKLGYLSKGDRLSPDDMPQDMLQNILAFIRSVDEQGIIRQVYLVRKTVSDTLFSSVFVIRFYGGTEAQSRDILHKIFRYLDSYPVDRQFSLFDYFRCPDVGLEKMEGCLVYSKENDTSQPTAAAAANSEAQDAPATEATPAAETTHRAPAAASGADKPVKLPLIVGHGGNILPQKTAMQNYFAEITDTSIIFTNDKLGVKREVPFSSFSRAEFGVGKPELWLQCVVDGSPFIFCMTRKHWKSPAGRWLVEKIGEQTELLDKKEYDHYIGKWFIFHLLFHS